MKKKGRACNYSLTICKKAFDHDGVSMFLGTKTH
jgi:hypothetical protein